LSCRAGRSLIGACVCALRLSAPAPAPGPGQWVAAGKRKRPWREGRAGEGFGVRAGLCRRGGSPWASHRGTFVAESRRLPRTLASQHALTICPSAGYTTACQDMSVMSLAADLSWSACSRRRESPAPQNRKRRQLQRRVLGGKYIACGAILTPSQIPGYRASRRSAHSHFPRCDWRRQRARTLQRSSPIARRIPQDGSELDPMAARVDPFPEHATEALQLWDRPTVPGCSGGAHCLCN
jgi:hypothetical protein